MSDYELTAIGQNHRKILDQILSLRAWHEEFRKGRRQSWLHVDVVFAQGNFVTADDNPISFTAELRNAVVEIKLSEAESVAFIPGSEWIRAPTTAKVRSKQGTKTQAKAGTKGIEGKVATSHDDGASFNAPHIKSVYWETSDRVREWRLSPMVSDSLEDRPWDPHKQKMIKIKDLRKNVDDGMPPTVTVSVKCHVKDIKVSLEDSRSFLNIMTRFKNSNSEKAALLHIKHCLAERGLWVEHELNSPNYIVQLGDILAEAR